MSQRTEKVASLITQIVASELANIPESAYLTVTKTDVTPDLREATVWIGILAGSEAQIETRFKAAQVVRSDLQKAVARKLETKFTPKLTLQHDVGGEYADHITRLIRGL